MRKYFYLPALFLCGLFNSLNAAVGDTTWVQSFHGDFTNYGAFDTGVVFPEGSVTYRKIYMIITIGEYNCVAGSQYCHQWDYDIENYVMTPRGDTLELGRFITPYATSGTPGFSLSWQQHYIYDVTDYYPILKDSATMQIFYSGYSWGFTGDVKFAFIEGTPERNVLGYDKLWNNTYTYGNTANPIDSNLPPFTLTPPAGTQSTEMKFIITGHGYDNATGCCEFDNTGAGHNYTIWANNNVIAQYNMNVNCGWSELYPQGGTWLSQRAGNWCPGGSVNTAQYPLTGFTAGVPNTTALSFDDSYNGGGAYGIYKISSAAFYYSAYNKSLDASMEDVIAPTNFEWYRRENPRVSAPVIKVRNTGATTITSLLIQYGVKDSALAQYIWTGYLPSSTDSLISLPAIAALTNLSVDSAQGTFRFIAMIQQVNGQTDNDQSNDTITSHFTIAPKWPYSFIVKLTTSSIGADGNFGDSPADASWQITDANNNVVASRTNANTTTAYVDTVTLNSSGFYALTVNTTQCYGLSWWALEQAPPNNTPGYTPGSFAVQNYLHGNGLLSLNSTANSGTYKDDFGCGFTQYFTTAGQCQAAVPTITQAGDTLKTIIAAAYQWYKNGVPITGAIYQNYTMGTANGNYTVEITDGTGCTATSQSYPFFGTGTTNISAYAAGVAIFPNPAKNEFNIHVTGELMGTIYSVYDITGRKVLAGIIDNPVTQVPVIDIAAGIYMVQITDGIGTIVKRVAVQK
jgi:Peptide-N-glycosidase F, C terminal/Secretion system C-terminal sorting domain